MVTTKPGSDSKATLDGIIDYGWRLVRNRNESAAVKFDRDWWYSEALIPWIGKYVWVRGSIKGGNG